MRYVLTVLLLLCVLVQKAHAQTSTYKADSIVTSIAPEYDKVGSGHRFWFGESYRKLWAAPVKMRVLDIKSEKGGLTILQRGGGLQTKSLRLKDGSGKEWVLRTIQKYPERGLPENLRRTIARDILQDQVVTGHPYAALTVPTFASALDIPHSSPEIVYVPDDPALGEHRKDFAKSVLLLELREPETLSTDNTEKAQLKVEEDNDTRFDQRLILRARLLDMLLGDWDRHEDQWRWHKNKSAGTTIYSPIPRDRDKVFYNTSGVLPFLLSRQWLKSNLQGYHETTRDIAGYNFNNRYFDRYFLNALSVEDWQSEISYVQSKITDDVIRRAMTKLPDPIYKLSAGKIIPVMIARRNNLKEEAIEYYNFLAKEVDIPASDKHEFFEIKRSSSGNTSVSIYKKKKDGEKGNMLYNRTFFAGKTKEVRLYGLAGNDMFSVSGDEQSPIKIRMIGGSDADSFLIDKEVPNKNKLIVYDDKKDENILPQKSQASIKVSSDSSINRFDRRSFKYDRVGPLFSLFFNLDQGMQLRVGVLSEKHGFRKEPYSSRQLVTANYATVRQSFMFTYNADFVRAIGKNDLEVNVLSRGPHNVSNFFGTGNETKFINPGKEGINFYRNRYDVADADVRLARLISKGFRISAGPRAEFYTSSPEHNVGRYLSTFNTSNPGQQVFADRWFGGFIAGLKFDSRNDNWFPNKGIHWTADFTAMERLNGDRKGYSRLYSELSFFIPILKDSLIVLANRVGGGTTGGNPLFYQEMQLGGARNIRGFNTNRFTGNSMFFHNLELRAKLFDFTSYLFPGTVGIIGFNDVGRVWVPHEKSDSWHHSWGGGIYIIPAELVVIQATFGSSVERTLPYISLGFRF